MSAFTDAQADFLRRKKNFEAAMSKAGSPVRMTDFLRTRAEQAALYARGRTKPGPKVTNARAGESPHNYALAADFCFLLPHGKITYNGNWNLFGKTAKACGLQWGGAWLSLKDRPHIEWPGWKRFKS